MQRPTIHAEQHKHAMIGEAWLLCEVFGWRLVSSVASAVANGGEYHGRTLESYEVDQVRDYVDNFGNEDFHKNVIQPFREAERAFMQEIASNA